MKPSVNAPTDHLRLPERLRLGQLPPPALRRQMRGTATLREMGRELGVSAMTVHRWETGAMMPRLDHAVAYRRLLDALADAAS